MGPALAVLQVWQPVCAHLGHPRPVRQGRGWVDARTGWRQSERWVRAGRMCLFLTPSHQGWALCLTWRTSASAQPRYLPWLFLAQRSIWSTEVVGGRCSKLEVPEPREKVKLTFLHPVKWPKVHLGSETSKVPACLKQKKPPQ